MSHCKIKTTAKFNYITEIREINMDEEHDTSDGYYFMSSEIWDEKDTEKPSVYSVNEINKQTQNNIEVKLEIKNKNDAQKSKTILNKNYQNIISLQPNTEKQIIIDFKNSNPQPNFVIANNYNTFGIFVRFKFF